MKKILVVEDDRTSRHMLGDFLRAYGYDARVAADGEAGLQMFLDDPPDLCLLDVQLPRKNGLEVAWEIRRTVEGREVPLVFMSAVLTNTTITESERDRFQAEEFLVKPFTMKQLLKLVASTIGPADGGAQANPA